MILSKFDKFFKYTYIAPPVIFSFLVFFSMNTSFECDSNTYFNFAKGNSISLLRGPGYPAFLFFSGMNFSQGSLYFVLLLQWFMGLAIALLIVSFLRTNRHFTRFIVSTLISSTGYTFYGARIFLAEQLTMFLSLIAIFFLLVSIRSKNIKFALLCVSFSSLAVLTRYEALPILGVSTLFLVLKYLKNYNFLKVFYVILVPSLILFGWSFVRSELLIGKTQFGTFANETGTQLMYSFHAVTGNEIIRLKQNGEKARSEEMYYFEITNGNATKKAKQIAQNHLKNTRVIFDRKYEGLSRDKSYAAEVLNIWEPAKDNPEIVYEWFFSKNWEKRSPQMILLLNDILVEEIGSKAADQLMTSVSMELVRANPQVLLLFMKYLLNWYGIDLNQPNKLYLGNEILSYWDTTFDPAFCASSVLSDKQFKEYTNFFSKYSNFESVQKIVAKIMEIFRVLFTLVILLWLGLVLNRKIKIDLQIILSLTIHLLVVTFLTISQAGINSKYTILPGAISLLAFVLIINAINGFISQKKSLKL
jgi:hypothetical protein